MYIYRKDGLNRYSDGIGHRTPSLAPLPSTKNITFTKRCRNYMKLAEELNNAADILEKQIDAGIREYLFLRDQSVQQFLEWRARFRFFLPGAAWDLVNLTSDEVDTLKNEMKILPYKAGIYSKINHNKTDEQDLSDPASRILNDYTMHSTYIESFKRLDEVIRKMFSISVKVETLKLLSSSNATDQFRQIEHHFNQKLSPEEIRFFARKKLQDIFLGDLYEPNFISKKPLEYHYSFASLYELMCHFCMLYENYSVEDPVDVGYFVFAVTVNFIQCFGQSLLEDPDLYKFLNNFEPNSFSPKSLTAEVFFNIHHYVRKNMYRTRKVYYTSEELVAKKEVMLRRKKLIHYSKPLMITGASSTVSTDPRLVKRARISKSSGGMTTRKRETPTMQKATHTVEIPGSLSQEKNIEEPKSNANPRKKSEEPVRKPVPEPASEPVIKSAPSPALETAFTGHPEAESDSEVEIIEELSRPS
ncbi:uncharacterized protein SAPINGB_P005859 [Magnusiomyces paraingens]|uniref:Uncharacterized protein n=1 Tax=Magnusiomyces paraingens TaxID=2606893 RepID=A0A5E8C261_9ASCO|nr:uncharacterized protein SAPINGB_P005859 [Saprochaete ingens]VVT57767.1 unnamed protein product [Saprochaete ingens]